MTLLSFRRPDSSLVSPEEISWKISTGLSKRSPFLAFAMLVAMASLAGVPFTAGFLGKFLVFDAAIATHHFGLVVVAIVTVGAGFYYYFKVVRAIYWDAPSSSTDQDYR